MRYIKTTCRTLKSFVDRVYTWISNRESVLYPVAVWRRHIHARLFVEYVKNRVKNFTPKHVISFLVAALGSRTESLIYLCTYVGGVVMVTEHTRRSPTISSLASEQKRPTYLSAFRSTYKLIKSRTDEMRKAKGENLNEYRIDLRTTCYLWVYLYRGLD